VAELLCARIRTIRLCEEKERGERRCFVVVPPLRRRLCGLCSWLELPRLPQPPSLERGSKPRAVQPPPRGASAAIVEQFGGPVQVVRERTNPSDCKPYIAVYALQRDDIAVLRVDRLEQQPTLHR
jgi:hypothetical protein